MPHRFFSATQPGLGTGCGSPGGSRVAAVLAGRAGRARPSTAVPAGHGRRSWGRALAVIPAMLHGSVDVDGGGYVTYILAQAKGIAKIRVLAAGFALGPHVNEIIALSRANIQSPADLRGKTIAVNQLGSVASDLTYTALAPYGITPDQVHLVAMPFPAMPGALAAGKFGAAYEAEPFCTEGVTR